MFLFYEGMIEEIFNNVKIFEEKNISIKIKIINYYKQTIHIYLHKIINYVDNLDPTVDQFCPLELLHDIKNYSDEIKTLENNFIEILNFLNSINFKNETLINDINNYNYKFSESQTNFENFMQNFENLTNQIFENVEFSFINPTIINSPKVNNDSSTTKEILKNPKEYISSNNNLSKLQDNCTLIISEKENKVFLPYKINDLELILTKTPAKYQTIKDLIDNEYIVSLDRFKNPILSRFKETYNLMKNKEHSSFIEAFNLSLELATNSFLNPAVIAACKNKDELDIYLDCLESQDLEKFDFFNIKYELNPIIKKPN